MLSVLLLPSFAAIETAFTLEEGNLNDVQKPAWSKENSSIEECNRGSEKPSTRDVTFLEYRSEVAVLLHSP